MGHRFGTQLGALAAAALLLGAGGCGDDASDTPSGSAQASRHEGEPPRATRREPVLGGNGELLESDQVLAGLTLPRGLELRREDGRRRIYGTRVKHGKVLKYFGQRLITGQVDRKSNGAIYRGAVPRGVQGTPVKLDVSILDTPGGCRIEIVELPPPPKDPLPRAETARRAQEDWKHLD